MEKTPLPSEINEKNSWPVTDDHSSLCDGRSRGWPGRGACDSLKCNDTSEWPSWECSQRNKDMHTDGMNGGVSAFAISLDEQSKGPATLKICSSDRERNLSIKRPSGMKEINLWPVTKDTNSCDGQSSKWPEWDACNSSKCKSSSRWPSWGSSREYKDVHKNGTIDKGVLTFSDPSFDEQRGATRLKEICRDRKWNSSSKPPSEINKRNSRRVANGHSSSHDGQSSKWPDWDTCASSKYKSNSGQPSWGSSQENKDVLKDDTIDKGWLAYSGSSIDEQRGRDILKESSRGRDCHSSELPPESSERNSCHVTKDLSNMNDGQSGGWIDWNACHSSKCASNSEWPSWGFSQENKDMHRNGNVDDGVPKFSYSSFNERRGQGRVQKRSRNSNRSKDKGWSRSSRWGKSSLGRERSRSAGRDFSRRCSRSPSNGPRQASYSLIGKESVFERTSSQHTNICAHVSGWGEDTKKSSKGSTPDEIIGLSKRPKSTTSWDSWVAGTAENLNFHYRPSSWDSMSQGTINLSDSTQLTEGEKFTKQGGDKKKSRDACYLGKPKASGWHGRSTYERGCHNLIDAEKVSHDNLVKTDREMAFTGQDMKVVNGENLLSSSGGLNCLASKKTVYRKEQIHVQGSECGGFIFPPACSSKTNESSLSLSENPSNGFDIVLDDLVKHKLLVKVNQMQVQFDETVKVLQRWASQNSITIEQAARLSKLEAYMTLISEYGRQIFPENTSEVHLNSSKVWGCEMLKNDNPESSATMLKKLEFDEGTEKNVMVEVVNGENNKNKQCKLEDKNIHMASLNAQCESEAGEDSQDNKSMWLFKNALVELVKEILNPIWMKGEISEEVHSMIVKKVVDKVISTEGVKIPKTQEHTDQYMSFSKPQISTLINEYVAYFKRKAISSG